MSRDLDDAVRDALRAFDSARERVEGKAIALVAASRRRVDVTFHVADLGVAVDELDVRRRLYLEAAHIAHVKPAQRAEKAPAS